VKPNKKAAEQKRKDFIAPSPKDCKEYERKAK
jgi:hypothetical protein